MTSEATKSSPGPAPEQPVLEAALRQTSDLGVNVVYTEIDVRLNTPPNATQVEAQVATYKRMAWSCMNVPKCVGMTVWGISDLYSWIPGVFPGEGSALLWDENYQKKPVYDGFLAGIKAKKTPNKPQ
jgi:endo-1,4-beta-xylanase